MSDRGIRIHLDTQELTPEYGAYLFGLRDAYGYFTFTEKELTPEEIEVPDTDFRSEKSPSARMRSVLYLLWKQSNLTYPFEQFYREKMESMIEKIKEKL